MMGPFVYLPHTQAAADHGVSWDAIRGYMQRRKLYRYPWLKRVGRKRYVRIDVMERYAATRSPGRPKGWALLKSLCADNDVAIDSGLRYRLLKGLRTQLYRKRLYVHPEDALLFTRRRQELRPRPCHTSLQELARTWGCSVSAVVRRAEVNSVSTHLALHRGRVQRFVPDGYIHLCAPLYLREMRNVA